MKPVILIHLIGSKLDDMNWGKRSLLHFLNALIRIIWRENQTLPPTSYRSLRRDSAQLGQFRRAISRISRSFAFEAVGWAATAASRCRCVSLHMAVPITQPSVKTFAYAFLFHHSRWFSPVSQEFSRAISRPFPRPLARWRNISNSVIGYQSRRENSCSSTEKSSCTPRRKMRNSFSVAIFFCENFARDFLDNAAWNWTFSQGSKTYFLFGVDLVFFVIDFFIRMFFFWFCRSFGMEINFYERIANFELFMGTWNFFI